METQPQPPKQYMTFREAAAIYPFTESSFRYHRHQGNSNGFNSCIRKVGRRVLLDVAAFEVWLDTQRDTAPRAA